MTVSTLAGSADANTSAGAPCTICVASVPDEPKLNVTLAPGFARLKSSPILPNASVSDAAADTVTAPVAFGVAEVGEDDDDFDEPEDPDELPQAASADPATNASASNLERRTYTMPPFGPPIRDPAAPRR